MTRNHFALHASTLLLLLEWDAYALGARRLLNCSHRTLAWVLPAHVFNSSRIHSDFPEMENSCFVLRFSDKPRWIL